MTDTLEKLINRRNESVKSNEQNKESLDRDIKRLVEIKEETPSNPCESVESAEKYLRNLREIKTYEDSIKYYEKLIEDETKILNSLNEKILNKMEQQND